MPVNKRHERHEAFRADKEQAKVIIEGLFPDRHIRESVLRVLVDAIRAAHAHRKPDKLNWAITLQQDRNKDLTRLRRVQLYPGTVRAYNCKLLTSFDNGLGYIQSQIPR